MLPGLVVLGLPGGLVPNGVVPLWSLLTGAVCCSEVGGLAGVVLPEVLPAGAVCCSVVGGLAGVVLGGVLLAGVFVLLQREFWGNSLHKSV